MEDAADRLVLTIHHAGDLAEARLRLSDPALIAWVRTAAPDLRRRDVAAGTLPRVALRVAVALGAVALILFVLLPAISDRLAAALPREQEVAFGRAVVRQMSELLGEGQAALVCDSPTGAAALERMVAAYPETRCMIGEGGWDAPCNQNTYLLFDMPIDGNGMLLSEDFAFCRRWQRIGGKVWMLPDIELGHTGPHEFAGKISDSITRQDDAQPIAA